MEFLGWLVILVCIGSVVGFVIFMKSKKKDKKKDECADGTCDKPVDPCEDGTCKPVDPCDDGSCDKPVEPVKPKEPITIKLSLIPNNEGTKVPEGMFCSRTKSIKAVEVITGNDCDTCVVRQWFDNGTENINNKGKIEIFPPFTTGHEFKYKVTIEDVSQEVSTGKIK
jgi:hypothetical protein